jgi:hypothetical protein
MNFRYNPFSCELADVSAAELSGLREVSEGWYVEYKSQPISVKAFGKSLSAFANQYGGWLIIGVAADQNTLCATAFPGVLKEDVPRVLQALRNSAKDTLNPEVFYETRVFDGPVNEIELDPARSIVVVRIPPGVDTPHVHIDGRIYRRVGDASDPRPENDRVILERLWRKGDRVRQRLAEFVTRTPVTSQAEENQPFLHLALLSDPYQVKEHWYPKGFSEFVAQMRTNPIPFDNFFSRAQGFVARQVADNQANRRVFTWEFSRNCDSFVTMPINSYTAPDYLAGYGTAPEFIAVVNEAALTGVRFLDLNAIFSAVGAIASRHRKLVEEAEIMGPFFVKAHLENVWRTVPFIDMSSYIAHVREYGIPVVQDESVLVPPGVDPVTFTRLQECGTQPIPADLSLKDVISISLPIFQALGIAGELFIENEMELCVLGERFREVQSLRRSS